MIFLVFEEAKVQILDCAGITVNSSTAQFNSNIVISIV